MTLMPVVLVLQYTVHVYISHDRLCLMFSVSTSSVKITAALIWLAGAVILFIKSSRLLLEAQNIDPEKPWLLVIILAGILIGGIKAKYLFNQLCYKNLRRIDALENHQLWKCYRPKFFLFLFLMISLGAYMSRIAQGDYFTLVSVALVDISIATALLGSIRCFWKVN